MEIAGWLQRLLPSVRSLGPADGCWVAYAKTQTPAHHPPFYWLGRALDAVEAAGMLDAVASRLLAAHGPEACEGWGERDEAAQDALSVACALAWVARELGPPQLVETDGGPRPLVHVPSLGVCLAPRRLRPARSMEALLEQLAARAEQAAADLPQARGRILYLDLNLNRRVFAQDVGYRLELTEPLRELLQQQSAERGLGWVLTRPFEWGAPIESWY